MQPINPSSPATCLVCHSKDVELFLDLGETALANKFRSREELSLPEAKFPLRVGFCPSCSHVQLTERVPPSAMFEDYLYMSSVSETLRQHLDDLSSIVVERNELDSENLVIDIGCNDGTLLKSFRDRGVRTLGVDPARNLAELESQSGIERYVGFFGHDSAQEILDRWGPAAAITATNTFPHLPNLDDFLKGIQLVMAPEGVFVIEAHYLLDMLEQGAFDTVYHEHVSYWALKPMVHLFARHGMEVVRAERIPLHHGQLRVTVMRAGEGVVDPSVAEILDLEHRRGLDRFETYVRFAEMTLRIKRDLHAMLTNLAAEGKQVAAYGAPAKGNTLLGYLELGPRHLEYIADRSPLKQGLYAPGSAIPIVPASRLLEDQPDYVLLLAWNFVDEILAQQAEYRRRGGRFILPVPEVRVIEPDTDSASAAPPQAPGHRRAPTAAGDLAAAGH